MAFPTQLNFGRDVQGFNAFAPPFTDLNFSASLPAGNENSITVPTSNLKWIVVISPQPGSTLWISINNTATPPAGSTFAETTSILNFAQLTVYAGDTISIYNNSSTAQDVGVSFYAVS